MAVADLYCRIISVSVGLLEDNALRFCGLSEFLGISENYEKRLGYLFDVLVDGSIMCLLMHMWRSLLLIVISTFSYKCIYIYIYIVYLKQENTKVKQKTGSGTLVPPGSETAPRVRKPPRSRPRQTANLLNP